MSACILWSGTINGSGYGVTKVGGRQVYAHRLAYEAATGKPLPARSSGLCLDHTCRNRACVNPDHLELVSLGANVLRGASPSGLNARKEVCRRGHPFEIRQWKSRPGRRVCMLCKAENRRRRKKGDQ